MNEYLSAGDPQTPEEARISALYKEAARETPPADLDRKIAAAARAGSRTASGGRLLSWLNTFRIPLATAAVLVVSASLVMTMREEHENRVMNSPTVAPRTSAAPAPAPEISAAEPPAQADRKSEQAPEVTPQEARESPMRRPPIARPSELELRKENSETAYGRYLKSSPPRPVDREKAEDKARTGASPADKESRMPVPAPMAAPAREPGFAVRPEAAAPAARDEAPTPPLASTPPVPLEKRAPGAVASPEVPAAPPAGGAAASPPPPPSVLSEPALRSFPAPAAPRALGALRRAQPKPSVPAPSPAAGAVEPAPSVGAADAPRERTPEERRVLLGRLQALNLPPPDISSHLVALESRPPAAWLERVRLLQRQGLLLEADRLLAEFKRRFPEEQVPADVQ